MKKLLLLSCLLLCYSALIAQKIPTQYVYLDSIKSFQQAIDSGKQLLKMQKNVWSAIELNYRIGLYYNSIEQFDSSLHYFNNGILLSKKSDKKELLPLLLQHKGTCYYYLYNRDMAYKTIIEGINEAEALKQLGPGAKMKSNAGALCLEWMKLDSAKVFLESSIKDYTSLNELNTAPGILVRRLYATYYQYKKNYKKAEEIYEQVLADCRKIDYTGPPYIGALTVYAMMHAGIGNIAKATRLIDEAAALDSATAKGKNKMVLYKVRSDVWESTKNSDSALKYLKLAFDAQEYDFNLRNNTKIAEAEAKLKNEILQRDLKISSAKRIRWILISALVSIITLFSWLLFYFYQKRKDALQKKKQAEISFKAFVDGEEKERVRLSRDLHDGIAQELLALKLEMKAANTSNYLLERMDNIGNEVRTISHQLMPYKLKELGLVAAIEDTCSKMLLHSNIQHEFDHDIVDERIDNKIEITIYRIFQELLSNIIKHSKATTVGIQLHRRNNFITLIVEDNGTGFDLNEKRSGIGLENLKSRVNLVNGNINFESNNIDGTIAIIRVPC